MSSLLSGLEQFGLGNLEKMEIYEEPQKEEEQVSEVKKAEIQETDLLFDKTYQCPNCDREFKEKTVKVGKAKLSSVDLDLRPKYENIDMIKYDVILCPHCGYTALSRYFKFLTQLQAKRIKEAISANYRASKEVKELYTYEDSLERYKMTLANAIVKQAKPSEKAYICLKTSWLFRGYIETLDPKDAEGAKKKEELAKQEEAFLKSAFEGFLTARQTEGYPMCGMDESTVDYLIAVTSMHFNKLDMASKLVAGILTSASANSRMKDKARNLKDMLMQKIKEQQRTAK